MTLGIMQMLLNGSYIETPCSYSHDLGVRAAWLSSASYCGWEEIKAGQLGFVRGNGYDLQAAFDQGAIAFRGSSNLENWLLDMDALKTEFKGAYVHKGFHTAWQALKPAVLNKTFNKSVLVTGHSLGGAIAQLAALDLAELGYNVTLVTFGSPRVGDARFAELLNKGVQYVYRVTHSRDPIVHVPYVFMGFIHAGPEIFYHDLKTFEVCNTATETISCGANTIMPLPAVQEHLDYLLSGISTCRLRPAAFLQ